MKRLTLKGQIQQKDNELFLSENNYFPLNELLYNYIFWGFCEGSYKIYNDPNYSQWIINHYLLGYLHDKKRIGSRDLLEDLQAYIGKWVQIDLELTGRDGDLGPWLTR